jgi:hypothetical protein
MPQDGIKWHSYAPNDIYIPRIKRTYVRGLVARAVLHLRVNRKRRGGVLEHSAQPEQYRVPGGLCNAYLSADHISKRKGKTNP